jgi:hypothetical protein
LYISFKFFFTFFLLLDSDGEKPTTSGAGMEDGDVAKSVTFTMVKTKRKRTKPRATGRGPKKSPKPSKLTIPGIASAVDDVIPAILKVEPDIVIGGRGQRTRPNRQRNGQPPAAIECLVNAGQEPLADNGMPIADANNNNNGADVQNDENDVGENKSKTINNIFFPKLNSFFLHFIS